MANTRRAPGRRAEAATLAAALERFRAPMETELRRVVEAAEAPPELRGFYGQMAYHLGWVDAQFAPADLAPGKLLRPALALWSCELAAAVSRQTARERARRLDRALPAAAAVELLHNFSLIHDDIEDRDELRRHRPTVWAVWGEAQGINTGDGMFCLVHLALWGALERGLPPATALRAAALLDRTALTLCEGQYLDMAFEGRDSITPAEYLDMIARKTAALMRAACQVGGLIGAPDDETLATALGAFGEDVGVGFQLRDDLLGIWAATDELGKHRAGDLRRKKMSLPVIYALSQAAPAARARLRTLYAQPGPATDDEIAEMARVIQDAGARDWCQAQLALHGARAEAALGRAVGAGGRAAAGAVAALGALARFVATQP